MILFYATVTITAVLAAVSAEAQTLVITRGGSRAAGPAPVEMAAFVEFIQVCVSEPSALSCALRDGDQLATPHAVRGCIDLAIETAGGSECRHVFKAVSNRRSPFGRP